MFSYMFSSVLIYYTFHIPFYFLYFLLVLCTFHILSYTFLCHFHILSYTMYFSYTVLFHILLSCTFNCILSSHSSAMLLISCYILYAFHLHILVILYFTSCSYNCLYFHRMAVLCFSYHVIYSIHVISF